MFTLRVGQSVDRLNLSERLSLYCSHFPPMLESGNLRFVSVVGDAFGNINHKAAVLCLFVNLVIKS